MFSLAVEIALTAAMLIGLYRIQRRALLVCCLIALNAATFGLFVVWIYPHLKNVWVIEGLIWLVESMGIAAILRGFQVPPFSMRTVALVALLGNLVSFLLGN